MNTAHTHHYHWTNTGWTVVTVAWLALGTVLQAQVAPPLSAETDSPERLISLNFRDSPLDMVLEFYSGLTGRTMIKAPGVNATITLRGQTRMTERESLQAIESALAMHNVALVPMGERFIRVVQVGAVRQEGMPILREIPEEPLPDTDQILSLIINLRHMEIGEVQPIIQQMIHGYGKIQPLERTNSMMITDTASNLGRIMEVLEFIDRPLEIREDIFVRQIRYAEAGQVASKLGEFIQDQAREVERPRVTPPTEAPRAPPGVIRPGRPTAAQPVAATPVEAAAELAERGIIQGQVKIVSDDRMNTLFIIARPVNFTFFDRIIDILDQPVDPEIVVRVINLEYALADEISGILNEFIGAASADAPARAMRAGAVGEDTGLSRAEALRDFAAGLAREQRQVTDSDEAAKIGRLSANTKILSDQRTNSLLLMGRRSDIAALEEIIDQLDIMLGQVLIEAVIVEINLGKTHESGIDWLQRTMLAYNETQAGPGGGITVRDPAIAFGGGSRPGSLGNMVEAREGLLAGQPPVGTGGLSYYLTFFDLNLDAIIRLAATSSDARILSTPVILTTDNTEAKIIVGESRPIVTSTATSTVGDRQVSSYQYRDIGIDLTVTPRINPQRFVVMDISQSADNVSRPVLIDGNEVPIITRREMSASIAVRSRSTIVLGGLISTDQSASEAKVPLLGDIPVLGRLFRYEEKKEFRTELLVLITPYVMMTPEEARMESARLHRHSHSSRTEWHQGWSESEFATPETSIERRRARPRLPAPKPIPLETGEYDREEVRDVLRALHREEPDPEPTPEPPPEVQEEPAGIIRWQTSEPEVIPYIEPERIPTIAPEVAPVPEPEPVPQPVREEPVREPAPQTSAPDLFAPVPFR